MATTTDIENQEQDIFEPQVIYIVSVDDDTSIASMERDSLTIELNEENTEFEPHSSRNIITSATTTNPQLSFTLARNAAAGAMDVLGIRDDTADGEHVRGDGRSKGRIELWYYEDDADPTVDSPALIDAFEDCRTDVEEVETETNVATISVNIHVNGGVYWNATSDLSTA